MRRLGAAMFVAGGLLFAVFASCSNDNGVSSQGDAGADAAIEDGAKKDWNVEPADTGPEFNTDGWLRLDYPGCNLYAAPSPDKMPAPFVWEPCSSIVAPLGISCMQIKETWPPMSSGGSGGGIGIHRGRVDASGKAWLALGYGTGGLSVRAIAEVDGRVHQALSYTRGTCSVAADGVAGSKSIWMVVQPKSSTRPEERGAIGGEVDSVPLVLEHWDDGAARSYYAGPSSYFALGPENALRLWTPDAPPLGNVVLTDPGQMLPRTFIGEELFYEVSNLSYARIKVYSPANGARDLVSFGNDVSKRAVDFGTDGVDMVWVEASGRAAVGDAWSTIDIMTAKHTTDALAIQKRRLRSEGTAAGGEPFTVGCGYASHYASTSTDGNIVRIVRLSDGRSWKLPEIFVDGGVWLFQQTHAITCDEIFMNVLSTNGVVRAVRIRLDSLGPGDPAD
jgi:hypothetical protein